jgi:hypothetical protein
METLHVKVRLNQVMLVVEPLRKVLIVQHDPKAHHCGAPTKSGDTCKMVTKSGLCHHHKK